MDLELHPAYEELVQKAAQGHQQHRHPDGISAADAARARLYAYAFRLHTIGAFHATRLALRDRPFGAASALAHRTRALEALEDLANMGMEPVPTDFRALLATLYRYHTGVGRIVDSLERELAGNRDPVLDMISRRFQNAMEDITSCNGIFLARDTAVPDQASFVVPGLDITIVPLVYGDHHSWNLAWLEGNARHVPTHRHKHGVEIHLGYNPTVGETVLAGRRAAVVEGYAMPIPPEIDHGWINTSGQPHHVPFIFGSATRAGWGVFFDVEAVSTAVDSLPLVEREAAPFQDMIYLEQDLAEAEATPFVWRRTLLHHTTTHRGAAGGLELNLTRIDPSGYHFGHDDYRIVSVARGEGSLVIEGIESTVREHDHFGIPAGLHAELKQSGQRPLVILDTLLRR
ncbi:MAG: hypothetical protein AB7K24_29115 [Gemmataceae bacterium]